MKNCININHPDVTILASELNLPKIVVAAKIGVWQEEHNILDRFPTTEELFTNSVIDKNIDRLIDSVSKDRENNYIYDREKGQEIIDGIKDKEIIELKEGQFVSNVILDNSQTSITLPQEEISHYSIRKLILENIKSDYQDLSKNSNKPDYQRITDNTISNFEKLSKREQETLTKNITHLSNKLSAITGISFQIINDPEQRFKGTLNNGKAIINLAYVTNDTPIHEILGHPIIRYIKTNNSELYNNLVNEINNSE